MLAEFPNSHLKVISTVRLHKLATIHCSSLASRLGHLKAAHRTSIATKPEGVSRLLAGRLANNDLNADGIVNIADIQKWAMQF